MKALLTFLIVLLLALQYKLWLADDGFREVWRLTEEVELRKHKIAVLQARNQVLVAEVIDLKNGLDAIEERARSEMGMIRQGESFYHLVGGETDGDTRIRRLRSPVDAQ